MKNSHTASIISCLTLVFVLLAPAPAFAETYTYDSSGRITSVTYDDESTIHYSYDNTGNMTGRAVGDGTLETTVPVVLDEIAVLLSTSKMSGKTRKKLKSARDKLVKAQTRLDSGNIVKGFTEVNKAVGFLVEIEKKLPGVDKLIDQLVLASKLEAQSAIDAALVAVVSDPDLIATAEADMTKAQTQLDKNKPDKAIKLYLNAWKDADKAILPDARGTYTGTYKNKVTRCKRKKDNGKYNFTVVIEITDVDGSDFSGTAVGTVDLGGLTAQEFISIAGNIDAAGRISGKTTHTFLATTGKGSFSGNLSGDNLTMVNKGKDKTGDTCKYTRNIKATR